MFNYNDPLTGEDVEVTDVSTAFYVLKICNDHYYGVYHQGQEVMKELARNSEEVYNQKYAIVEPYLPMESDTDVTTGAIVYSKPTTIPPQLPPTVPQSVRDAMDYLDEQYSIESQRLHAELADDTAEIKETIARLESKVAAWFENEVRRRAAWLGRSNTVILSGCELHYSGGNVSFSYNELNYN